MLQSLPIALAQIKAGNTSDNLLNKIKQMRLLIALGKKKTKKYIIKSI